MKRRTLLQGAVAAPFVPAKFAIAQPASARTLVFVPQAHLTLLDPIFTTAQPTVHHGWAIYDLLFAVTSKLEIRPQMAERYTLSNDRHSMPPIAFTCCSTMPASAAAAA
jgi:peptide/nickel transport system substrate-binding protein